MNFFYARHSPTPPLALPVYPPGQPLPDPAHPDGLHITGGRADHARHGAPVCIRYQTGHAGQIRTVVQCWSVSETVQICTHSNMNDFQHKNVCKTIDINTRTCYYIDNTRTCYTTTKQEDKNHDEQ